MIVEGHIEIAVPESSRALKFDGVDHGLSHCMKAVDYIVETPRSLLFVEIKDPDVGQRSRRTEFIQRFVSGGIDGDLKYKFRDTWLYLYGMNRLNKPVQYMVLICIANISTESLVRRTDALKRNLPIVGPNGDWTRPLLQGCVVANLESWNRLFPDFPARRV